MRPVSDEKNKSEKQALFAIRSSTSISFSGSLACHDGAQGSGPDTMFGLCDPSSTPGLTGCEGCQALNLAEKNKLCLLGGFDIEKLSEYIGEIEAEKGRIWRN